ncbi:hypothetical protein PIROE2DRAFT_3314 [Piromyces sp. E2]|nr:hypothetical protein PIROE2DRAFT_3314 [Piromyces sp. E2]|eukprot:OUM68924.1 hypothetical protein PIROE2DRAFT_3314 [Piromyces sp. E2]
MLHGMSLAIPTCGSTTDAHPYCIAGGTGSYGVADSYCVSSDVVYKGTNSGCTAATVTSGNYYAYKISGAGDAIAQLVTDISSITNEKLVVYEASAGNKLDAGNQVKSKNYFANSRLLTCAEGGECTLATTPGYYLGHADAAHLVKLEGETATLVGAKDNAAIPVGYFIDGSNPANIISCNASHQCSSSGHSGTDTAPTHFLSNDKRVITCTAGGCVKQPATVKGYFVNADSTDVSANQRLIKCEAGTNGCSKMVDVTDCATAKAGGAIYENSSTLRFCTGSGENGAQPSLAETSVSAKPATLAAASDFPGNTNGIAVVKVMVGLNAAVLVEPSQLPPCSDVTSTTAYCGLTGLTSSIFCIHTNAIYSATSGGCTAVTLTQAAVYYYRQNGAANSQIFTDGLADQGENDSGYYVVYQAANIASPTTVEQITGKNFFVSNQLMVCDNSGRCHIPSEADEYGIYYDELSKKMIRFDEDGFTAEDKKGFYDLGVADKLYVCKGSTITCTAVASNANTCTSTGNNGNINVDSPKFKVCIYTTGAVWTPVLGDSTAAEAGYRIIPAAVANAVFGDNAAKLMKSGSFGGVRFAIESKYEPGVGCCISDVNLWCGKMIGMVKNGGVVKNTGCRYTMDGSSSLLGYVTIRPNEQVGRRPTFCIGVNGTGTSG